MGYVPTRQFQVKHLIVNENCIRITFSDMDVESEWFLSNSWLRDNPRVKHFCEVCQDKSTYSVLEIEGVGGTGLMVEDDLVVQVTAQGLVMVAYHGGNRETARVLLDAAGIDGGQSDNSVLLVFDPTN